MLQHEFEAVSRVFQKEKGWRSRRQGYEWMVAIGAQHGVPYDHVRSLFAMHARARLSHSKSVCRPLRSSIYSRYVAAQTPAQHQKSSQQQPDAPTQQLHEQYQTSESCGNSAGNASGTELVRVHA
jgi:hypothetical protein